MRNSGQAGGCDSLMNSHGAAYERDSSMSHCCSMCWCCHAARPRAQSSALSSGRGNPPPVPRSAAVQSRRQRQRQRLERPSAWPSAS